MRYAYTEFIHYGNRNIRVMYFPCGGSKWQRGEDWNFIYRWTCRPESVTCVECLRESLRRKTKKKEIIEKRLQELTNEHSNLRS